MPEPTAQDPNTMQVRLWKDIPGNMLAREPISTNEVHFFWCPSDGPYAAVEVLVFHENALAKRDIKSRPDAREFYKRLRAEGYSVETPHWVRILSEGSHF